MTKLDRRQALAAFGSVSLAGLLAACGDGDSGAGTANTATVTTSDGATATVQPSSSTSKATADLFETGGSCQVTTELTEGPYYFDVDSIRSDITEGKDGTKLRLALRVRDADGCAPIANAVVDIWHCDAGGVYSGFESASQGGPGGGRTDDETYLRGAQATNKDGVVEFTTIYPGWYRGRTTHIHAKVHLDRQTALTSQLFFDDDFTTKVYEREPYASAGSRDMLNASDGIYEPQLELKLSEEGDAVLGVMTFDVNRA